MREAKKKAAGYAKQLEDIAARHKPKSKPKPKMRPVEDEKLVHKVARKLLEIYYRPKKKFKPTYGKYVKAGLSGKDIKRMK